MPSIKTQTSIEDLDKKEYKPKQRKHRYTPSFPINQSKIPLLEACILTYEQILNVCQEHSIGILLNKNYEDTNLYFQVQKLKIWSFLLLQYHQNRDQLKLSYNTRRSIFSQSAKFEFCLAEIRCACQLIKQIQSSVELYIKQLLRDPLMEEQHPQIIDIMSEQDIDWMVGTKRSRQREVENNLYIAGGLLNLVYSNLYYLPQQSALFWDVEDIKVLMRIMKMEEHLEIVEQNLMDGFVFLIITNPPFKEQNVFLKCLLLNTSKLKNQGSGNGYKVQHQERKASQQYLQFNSIALLLNYILIAIELKDYDSHVYKVDESFRWHSAYYFYQNGYLCRQMKQMRRELKEVKQLEELRKEKNQLLLETKLELRSSKYNPSIESQKDAQEGNFQNSTDNENQSFEELNIMEEESESGGSIVMVGASQIVNYKDYVAQVEQEEKEEPEVEFESGLEDSEILESARHIQLVAKGGFADGQNQFLKLIIDQERDHREEGGLMDLPSAVRSFCADAVDLLKAVVEDLQQAADGEHPRRHLREAQREHVPVLGSDQNQRQACADRVREQQVLPAGPGVEGGNFLEGAEQLLDAEGDGVLLREPVRVQGAGGAGAADGGRVRGAVREGAQAGGEDHQPEARREVQRGQGRQAQRLHPREIGVTLHPHYARCHKLLSKKHIELTYDYHHKTGKEQFLINDLQSHNGTWLRLSGKQTRSQPFDLQPNSQFSLSFELVFTVDEIIHH